MDKPLNSVNRALRIQTINLIYGPIENSSWKKYAK